MKFRTLSIAPALAFGFALFHCGGGQNAANAPTNPDTQMAPAERPPTPPEAVDAGNPDAAVAPAAVAVKSDAPKADALTDEQIAAVTEASNSAEIEQAKLAQLKSKNAAVKRFSAMMLAHHGEAKKSQDKLKLSTADSALSTTLGTDAATTMTTLKKAEGKDFDEAYAASQVEAHRKLLTAIDAQLLPGVKNPDLKAYLNDIRPKVAHHLQAAEDLQQSLGTKSAAQAPAKAAD